MLKLDPPAAASAFWLTPDVLSNFTLDLAGSNESGYRNWLAFTSLNRAKAEVFWSSLLNPPKLTARAKKAIIIDKYNIHWVEGVISAKVGLHRVQ